MQREQLAQDLYPPTRIAREGLQVDLSSFVRMPQAMSSQKEEPAARHVAREMWNGAAA